MYLGIWAYTNYMYKYILGANTLLEAVRHFRSIVIDASSRVTTAHVHLCCIFHSYAKTVPSRMKLTMREPASMTTDTGRGEWRHTPTGIGCWFQGSSKSNSHQETSVFFPCNMKEGLKLGKGQERGFRHRPPPFPRPKCEKGVYMSKALSTGLINQFNMVWFCYCTHSLYAVKAQTSLAPLSRFRGSRITTAHAHQCCRFQSYAKTVPSRMKLTMKLTMCEPTFMGSMTTDHVITACDVWL